MAPKKKEQKMSLGAFLQEEKYGGSWADEVEDSFGSQPLPTTSSERRTGGFSSYGAGGNNDRGYYTRDSYATQAPAQLPTKPPYTAHLGNLSYDATTESVTDFFQDCELSSVRIIEDKIEQRPKGFAYAEFANVEGLKKALTLDGTSFQGRTIRIKIADPPKERQDRGESARDLSSWERKGPLADLPSRGGGGGGDRRPSEFSERRGPGPRDAPSDDGKVRDFGNWERKGPLSPLPAAERPAGSRDSSRPRTNDANRGESFRKDRRTSPATWGEGRQEGSRPPREFKERAERPERPERPERAPTAADLDNQWRSNMRPDRTVKSPEQSRDGSEAPPSPATSSAAAPAPAGRPRLNLKKRTVSDSPDVASPGLPPSADGDNKASPFGAARPIDTAAKEREIAEKKEQQLKEKREADEKAKEERRIAKEAAAKEAAEKAAAEAEKAKAEPVEEKPEVATESKEEPKAEGAQNGGAAEQKLPIRPKENVQNPKSRATESGNWRTSSGEQRPARGGYVNAQRGRGEARGRGGAPRGPRGNYEGRPARANGNSPASPQQPAQPSSPAPTTESAPAQEADGWTTVPAKGGRRNQGARA
ncbi:uncharacterized protein F4822DRAFT_27412 [Hypoxylon trugodes]|uniref:uncharacterized protein n=1 Tax=Hypoxylon trugodes TaxID=326681 RepID=UPI0021A23E05|nr:uncharacterized protein F4822DRAFT_27412 [Hypoxylon trugodes]KAI1393846.1 hypothetical protein F4822DRAFT_27412 [Hypoxylon trugodes]